MLIEKLPINQWIENARSELSKNKKWSVALLESEALMLVRAIDSRLRELDYFRSAFSANIDVIIVIEEQKNIWKVRGTSCLLAFYNTGGERVAGGNSLRKPASGLRLRLVPHHFPDFRRLGCFQVLTN